MRRENLRPNNNEQLLFVSATVILILIGGGCAIKELTDPKIITSTNPEVQDSNNLDKFGNPNDSIFRSQKKD